MSIKYFDGLWIKVLVGGCRVGGVARSATPNFLKNKIFKTFFVNNSFY